MDGEGSRLQRIKETFGEEILQAGVEAFDNQLNFVLNFFFPVNRIKKIYV